MNKPHHYTLLAAGIVAALPELAAAHGGTHLAMAVANLNYSEAYTEKLKGGQALGAELLLLNGHFQFNEHVGIADLSLNTDWKVRINGSLLAEGMLNDAAKKKFSAKNGMATIGLPGGGSLNLTWTQKMINFTLKWKGKPTLAESFKGKTGDISLPQAAIDISIGSLYGYFNVPAQGKAKARMQKGIMLSNVSMKGKAISAGLNTLDRDADTFTADVDCNDFDASVYPGAKEATLDGVDSNCDGRDSGVPEVVDKFANPGMYSSPAINFKNASLPGPGATVYGPLRDFSGYNKSFVVPVGKSSFYDPSTGVNWNDDTFTPAASGQTIWRGWTHTGKWSFFNGNAGDKVTIGLQPDASMAGMAGTHPGFLVFWRPEGSPLTWVGTQDIAAGQTVPGDSDIVPGHILPQHADWTLQGMPAKTDHTAPSGVDPALYPVKNDSYTLYYVDSGYDADKYDPTKKFVMHPTALSALAVTDGVAGSLSKAITLPKTGYYLVYVGNVLEVSDWSVGADGKFTTTGQVWDMPGKGTSVDITVSKP
ncbi:MAG: MopE-related protein [Methylococcaceae bacterium]|nr:MopE-related protein [Methylococcaceae bacterium]